MFMELSSAICYGRRDCSHLRNIVFFTDCRISVAEGERGCEDLERSHGEDEDAHSSDEEKVSVGETRRLLQNVRTCSVSRENVPKGMCMQVSKSKVTVR